MVKAHHDDTPSGSRCRVGPVVAASMERMADTITRPTGSPGQARAGQPAQASPRRAYPRALVGVAVALWTALLGLACLVCLTLAAWVTAAHHEDAVRPALATAVQAWLLAHHTGLAVASGSVAIVPLGLTAGLAALLVRGGRQAARLSHAGDVFDCLTTALAVATPYAVVAALLTRAARWGQVRPMPVEALAGAFVLAIGCCVFGALRETEQWAPLLARLPVDVRLVLRAGFSASVVLVGSGGLIVVVGLATHTARATALMGSLHGGLSGTVLLSVVSVAYVPNVVGWAGAFSAGPGFGVGANTSVALSGVHLGAVPALPLLAPLPSSGAIPLAGWLVLAGPVAAGLLAGWLVARDRPDGALRLALAAGAVAGSAMGIFGWLSAGALGPGRMADVGPVGWQVALAVAVEIGVLSAVASWVLCWRRNRRSQAVDASGAAGV
jgi:hypothetical protein